MASVTFPDGISEFELLHRLRRLCSGVPQTDEPLHVSVGSLPSAEQGAIIEYLDRLQMRGHLKDLRPWVGIIKRCGRVNWTDIEALIEGWPGSMRSLARDSGRVARDRGI